MKRLFTVGILIVLVTMAVPTASAINPPSDTIDIVATSDSFLPNTVTASAGQKRKLRFTVPSTDTYCCGLEIRSAAFPTLTIAKGGEATTDYITITSSFMFSSYWPSSNVHKADGTITIQPSTEISAPTITKVQPGKFKRRTSGTFTITITGTHFAKSAKVKVKNIPAKKVTFVSENSIKAVIPRTALTIGIHNVTVTNADGGKVTKKRSITIVR